MDTIICNIFSGKLCRTSKSPLNNQGFSQAHIVIGIVLLSTFFGHSVTRYRLEPAEIGQEIPYC